jgi:adenylate cyclase
MAGQPATAIEHFHTYFRLNPRGLRGPVLTGIGFAHLFQQRHKEAVEAFRASLQLLPSYSMAYCGLASCYTHMGRLDDARATVERLGGITPLVTRATLLFRNPEQRELILAGLRLAAGETD